MGNRELRDVVFIYEPKHNFCLFFPVICVIKKKHILPLEYNIKISLQG